MNTYLFGWNPVKYTWPDLDEDIAALKRGTPFVESWTCASHKKVQPGDRAFFVHVGKEPRGLFGSGFINSKPFKGKNWKGKACYRVDITFEVLLNPAITPILTLDLLNMSHLSKQNWTPQSSGISIRAELVDELELLWKDFVKENSL